MSLHEVLGMLAASLSFFVMFPYVRSILRDETRPHIFSWFLWGLFHLVIGIAQLYSDAGPGAWANFSGALGCWVGAGLGYWKGGSRDITRSDCVAFTTAILGIVPWLLTKDPLLSVVIITGIDVLSYYPSFRKGWFKPYEDMSLVFFVCALEHTLAISALSSFTFTNVVFSAYLVIINLAYAVMLVWRRQYVAPSQVISQ